MSSTISFKYISTEAVDYLFICIIETSLKGLFHGYYYDDNYKNILYTITIITITKTMRIRIIMTTTPITVAWQQQD